MEIDKVSFKSLNEKHKGNLNPGASCLLSGKVYV